MKSLETASTEELFGNLEAMLSNMQKIHECCQKYKSVMPEGVLHMVSNTYTAHLYELAKRSVDIETIGGYFEKWEATTRGSLRK